MSSDPRNQKSKLAIKQNTCMKSNLANYMSYEMLQDLKSISKTTLAKKKGSNITPTTLKRLSSAAITCPILTYLGYLYL